MLYIYTYRLAIFMVIAVASINASVYKYVIHRIAISYAAGHAIFAQIGEKCHRLFCRSTLYLYLYCIYIVLLYLRSTCANKMFVRFTILFHLKTMSATTFNTFQVCECLLGCENCCMRLSSLHATFINK